MILLIPSLSSNGITDSIRLCPFTINTAKKTGPRLLEDIIDQFKYRCGYFPFDPKKKKKKIGVGDYSSGSTIFPVVLLVYSLFHLKLIY